MADPVIAPAAAGVQPVTPAAAVPPVVPATPAAGDPSAAPGVTPPIAPPATELGAKPAEPAKPADATVAFDATKLTLPEGLKADDPGFKSFGEIFADDKLDPQAKGQRLINLYKDSVLAIRQQQQDVWKTTNDGWVAAVKSDPDIGGAKFEPTKATIARAIDSLGPELSVAFRQGLDATGAGNHPAIWKGLAKMAALLTEGGHVSGNPASAKPNISEAFFPNSKMT